MSANSYVTDLANRAIIRDMEKESIRRSIDTLASRLRQYFGSQISEQFQFGSYTRGTILPRCMDANSDVDYMVVFSTIGYRPQTYLDRLRRFVEHRYSRSEIEQSHPTIVLNLNHIRFELVPALSSWGIWGGYQIPGPASSYQEWVTTDPNGFNAQLTQANQRHRSLIKPLIRVVKYWNVRANKPFASYALEQWIVERPLYMLGVMNESRLCEYVYETFDDMGWDWTMPQWKRDAIVRAKRLAKGAAEKEHLWGDAPEAERLLRRLFPDPGC
jgi:hypothetical protein